MLWWKILWDIILFRWHHQVRTKAYLSWTEYPSELKSRSRLCHSNLLIWIFQLLWQLTVKINKVWNLKSIKVFFFYLGFLSWTFTIRRTAEEKGGYLFNSPLPLSPASQLNIIRVITAESSSLHRASSRTRILNLWFPGERKTLINKRRANKAL